MEEKGPKNKQGRKGRGVLQREADEEEHGTVDQQDVEKHENGDPPTRSGSRDRQSPDATEREPEVQRFDRERSTLGIHVLYQRKSTIQGGMADQGGME